MVQGITQIFRLPVILVTFISVAVCLKSFALPASQQQSLKTFNEWKLDKVNTAIQQTSQTRVQALKAKARGDIKNLEALNKQISQLNWNLEVAKDLTLTDYFVLYLAQQPGKDLFKQIAPKMTTQEVADLMQAYAKTLSTSPSPDVETSSPASLESQALLEPESAK